VSARPAVPTAVMKHARDPGRGMSGVFGHEKRPQWRACCLGKDSAGKLMVSGQGWHSTSSGKPGRARISCWTRRCWPTRPYAPRWSTTIGTCEALPVSRG